VGGAWNHIHIITHINPAISLSSIVKDIKIASHNMILENNKIFWHFPGWQVGYGGFTYHISAKNNLIRYVENQQEHHMKVSYKEELSGLLDSNCVDFDDEYLII
jgi:putative transposase